MNLKEFDFSSPFPLLKDNRFTLVDCIDKMYEELHERVNGVKAIRVRDYGYPGFDPRHFGLYPDKTEWVEMIVTEDFASEDVKLEKGDRIMVKHPIDKNSDCVVAKRIDEHLVHLNFCVAKECVGAI